MIEIHHVVAINTTIDIVFEAISTAAGLDNWWTKSAAGTPHMGNRYQLHFDPNYNWEGEVTKYQSNQHIEWKMIKADNDWHGTKFGFHLEQQKNFTQLSFYHIGWKMLNQHYSQTNFCWAMYLRLLKRYLEFGEFVPYANRLDV